MIKIVLLLLISGLTVSASGITPCSDHLGQNVLGIGFQCSQGGLLFNNFLAPGSASVPNPQVYLVSASTDSNGDAVLQFNPFLTATGGAVLAMDFYFQVTNPVERIELTTSGLMASINEVICRAPLVGGVCAPSNTLADITAASQTSAGISFAQTSPIYVYKHIVVTSTPGQAGEISSFYQSFSPEEIPEPATTVLLGGGLVLILGLAKRRRQV